MTLSWSFTSGSTYYSVAVRDLVTNALVVDTTTTSTAFTAGLINGRPYRWNVAACNSTGCSSYTTVRYFQTPSAQSIPGVPQNPGPGSTTSPGPTQSSNSVTLGWSASAGATYYGLGVRDLVTNQLVVDTNTSSTSHSTTLTAGRPYRWNVSACNNIGCSSFTAVRYFQTPASQTIPSTPANPQPGTPNSPGPTQSSSVVALGWSGVSGATYYGVAVRDLSTNVLVVDTTTTGNSFTVSLTAGRPYRWNVAACNNAGCSSYTTPLYFQTPAAQVLPGAPQNLSAAGGNSRVALSWAAPSSNGGSAITSYRVFRGTSSSDRTIVTSGGCANLGAVLSCTDTNVTNGQSYNYIVSAVNGAGQGPPSSFATATPGSANPGGFSLTSAAPSCDAGSPRIVLGWTASTGVSAYDIFRNGDLYASVSAATLAYTNTGALSPGVSYTYYLRARNGSGSTNSNSRQVTGPACGSGTREVSVSPSAADAGTVLGFSGRGLVKNGMVVGYLQAPNGQRFILKSLSTTSSGEFRDSIATLGFSPGTYYAWAIETASGAFSNLASFDVRTSSTSPAINNVSVSRTNVTAGETVVFSYAANNPRSTSVSAFLGATIVAAGGGAPIANPPNDRVVSLPPGTSLHQRSFTVPTTAAGSYDVIWTLWNQSPASESGAIQFSELRRPNALTVNATLQRPTLVSLRSDVAQLGVSDVRSAVNAGELINFSYEINNPNSSPIEVFLDLIIKASGGTVTRNDPKNGRTVTVPPGVHVFSRPFRVPSDAEPAYYDVAGELWNRDPVSQSAIASKRYADALYHRALHLVGLAPRLEGRIISPLEGATFGTNTLSILAEATSNTASPVAYVQFLAFHDSAAHDGGWRLIGTDDVAPYQATLTLPSSDALNFVADQKIKIAIKIVDRAGHSLFPAAVVTVNYDEPGVDKRYIPESNRRNAYFNQLSVVYDPVRQVPDGRVMCGASSIVMALAMSNLLDKTPGIMRETAIRIFPDTKKQGNTPNVEDMYSAYGSEFGKHGWKAERRTENVNDGWDTIKTQIRRGWPVILRSPSTGITSSGHYIVVVGYRQTLTSRHVWVYDPNGEWGGNTTDVWAAKNSDKPDSQQGMWKMYSFPRVFLGTEFPSPTATYDLFIANPSGSNMTLTDADLDIGAPDGISEEPRVPGKFDGVNAWSPTFTDDPLLTGVTPMRAVHIAELRSYVDELRIRYGLAVQSWTDPTLTPGVTVARTTHILELRAALREVYVAAGATPPSYSDASLSAGSMLIRLAHISELREAIAAIY